MKGLSAKFVEGIVGEAEVAAGAEPPLEEVRRQLQSPWKQITD